MTPRDEARAKCIEAIDDGVYAATGSRMSRKALTKIFDSLNGIVTVNPPEATEEMMQAWINAIRSDPKSCMNAALATGDLTNAPGKKP